MVKVCKLVLLVFGVSTSWWLVSTEYIYCRQFNEIIIKWSSHKSARSVFPLEPFPNTFHNILAEIEVGSWWPISCINLALSAPWKTHFRPFIKALYSKRASISVDTTRASIDATIWLFWRFSVIIPKVLVGINHKKYQCLVSKIIKLNLYV